MKKVVSFDIWDTIIKRKCHPEEIKLKTMNYLYLTCKNELKDEYKNIYELLKTRDNIEYELCQKALKDGCDDECKIEDVFELLLKKVFLHKCPISAKELLKVEMNNEKEAIYINPDILPIFSQYKDLDMYCVSDFYMSEKELKELLDYLKLPVKIKKVYSSADYLLNKRTGNLYKKFESDLIITPEDHIHVGDNPYSDIKVANDLGITTIKMTKTDYDFNCDFNRKMHYDLSSCLKDESKESNKFYNEGVKLAPLLYFFGYSIVSYAIENNIDTVYYQTREGETFIKIHELIAKENPFDIKIPDAKIMEVSRMGTFAPSLKELTVNELLRLWSQYRVQSMKTLFKTLHIDINDYKEYFDKYEIDINEDISEPWFNVNIQKLFADREFKEKIDKVLSNKKKELLNYFEKSLNIVNDDKPLFVVDIGWRGTIQDNLAYIFDKKKIDGYYLTLYDYYNLQPVNTSKTCFIDDKDMKIKEVADIITLLEWIFNPGTGSVVEYSNGKAVRKAKEKELNIVKKYIKPMQEGMLAGAKVINEYIKYHPYHKEETKNVVYSLIRDIKKNPSEALIEAYYSMVFNDTFGTSEYIEKDCKLTFIQKLNIFKVRNILRKESWKEAYIVYNKLGYMKMLMGIKGAIRKVVKRK